MVYLPTRMKLSIAGVTALSILVTVFALMTSCAPTPANRVAETRPLDTLAAGFVTPPDSARPFTWWHWMNGNVTKEGITLDLEAMKRVGIGGFQIFDVGEQIAQGPVIYGSPEWLALKQHAAQEAERLGLEFDMHNCPGWSSSGGPWITPEYAMQQLVWTETFVAGGKRADVLLAQPAADLGYYRDAFVLALPATPADNPDLLGRITLDGTPVEAKLRAGGNLSSPIEVRPTDANHPAVLLLEFTEPIAARSITIAYALPAGTGTSMRLEVSDTGASFRKVCDISATGGRSGAAVLTADFPAVQARYFRLSIPQPGRITQVQLSGFQPIPGWRNKANFSGGRIVPAPAPVEDAALDPNTVIDVTQQMNAQGRLTWAAPAGNWIVLRLGHTALDRKNVAAPSTGRGLECDKYSRAAIEFHFQHMFEKLLPSLASLAKKGKAGLLIDSYETGFQNWTAEFPQEFQRRRGYDLRRYLPAMTGRVVGSSEVSERFLWDVRRTQADMIADNYYGHFGELCRRNGLKFYVEPYSGGPFEEMQIGSRADLLMGEFWQGQADHYSVKLAASIAHINGKQIVGAESFTSQSRWTEYPYSLKALGDYMYTQGLNRYIFHRHALQPHPTAAPGMTMGPWGGHFDRTNTWWNQGAAAWLQYVARCQYLLQQGLFVADVAYFVGEDAPAQTPQRTALKPPQGYDYDTINAEALLTRAKVRDGRIVMPDGMSYRVLVLPDKTAMTVRLLRRIRDMVSEGMWLMGPKPEHSLGLTEYPSSEGVARRIAAEIWGDLDGQTRTERTFGKGHVFWGQSVAAVLGKLSLVPDFESSSRSDDATINSIHRRIGDTDVYFVANRKYRSEDLVCTFRVDGKLPEFWSADSGQMIPASVYDFVSGRVRVPIRLGPAGSVFVVFRSPAPAQRLQDVLKDNTVIVTTEPFSTPQQQAVQGRQAPAMPTTVEQPPTWRIMGDARGSILVWEDGTYTLRNKAGGVWTTAVSTLGQPTEIVGPWRLAFPPNLGAPAEVTLEKLISWPEHSDNGVKYFSGTATYTKRVKIPADAVAGGKRLYLDLGRVMVLAEVLVNGRNLGVLWKAPYQVDITDAVHPGDNNLEIRVTNLWPNRLIGDEQLPAEYEFTGTNPRGRPIARIPDWYLQGKPRPAGQRVTFTVFQYYTKDSPLLESGLIGPVRLRSAIRLATER